MVQNIKVGSLSRTSNNDCRPSIQGSKHCLYWIPSTPRYEKICSQWCKSFCSTTPWCLGISTLSYISSEWYSFFRRLFRHIFCRKIIFSCWTKSCKYVRRIEEMLWKPRWVWSCINMPILYSGIWKICLCTKLITRSYS